jgi:hypothetical protein
MPMIARGKLSLERRGIMMPLEESRVDVDGREHQRPKLIKISQSGRVMLFYDPYVLDLDL